MKSADAMEQPLPAQPREDRLVQPVLPDELGWTCLHPLGLQLVAVAVLVGDLDFRGADGAGDGGADAAQAVRPHVVEGELPGVDVQGEVGLAPVLGPGGAAADAAVAAVYAYERAALHRDNKG